MGVDIGKRNCVVCIMDSDGSIIEETKYDNTLDHAKSFASYIKRKLVVVVSLLLQQYANQLATFG